jgi:hypothetical protein
MIACGRQATVTDWLKPGAVPPDAASDLHDDDEISDDTDTREPSTTQRVSGGQGTVGGHKSPRGSRGSTDDTLRPGDDPQSDWLRDARGGRR